MTPRPLFLTMLLLAGTAVSAHAATIRVTIEKLAFTPVEVNAKVGDTIEWINKDAFAHTATAKNGDWDVMIGPNKTARLVVKKAGATDYYCRFHPNMTGRVTVTP